MLSNSEIYENHLQKMLAQVKEDAKIDWTASVVLRYLEKYSLEDNTFYCCIDAGKTYEQVLKNLLESGYTL